jgi:hypothetical protein
MRSVSADIRVTYLEYPVGSRRIGAAHGTGRTADKDGNDHGSDVQRRVEDRSGTKPTTAHSTGENNPAAYLVSTRYHMVAMPYRQLAS